MVLNGWDQPAEASARSGPGGGTLSGPRPRLPGRGAPRSAASWAACHWAVRAAARAGEERAARTEPRLQAEQSAGPSGRNGQLNKDVLNLVLCFLSEVYLNDILMKFV
jgi:hypothetical protein